MWQGVEIGSLDRQKCRKAEKFLSGKVLIGRLLPGCMAAAVDGRSLVGWIATALVRKDQGCGWS
jgi:hypothetical protein